MNISQLTNSSTSNTSSTSNSLTSKNTSTKATTSASPVSNAMTLADARIQSQLDTTTTQLSSFGKLKSSVSDAQLAARALSGLTTTTSAADLKATVNRFVMTFNAAIATAKSTATSAGGVSAESSSAGQISRDLSRTFTVDTTLNDGMRKMGFKQLPDGTLAFDSAKFDAAQKADPTAMQSTLSKIGQLVDKTATKELATGGSVDGSMAALNKRSTLLKTHQTAMLDMVQKFATAQTSSTSGFAGYGLAAYKSSYL